MRAKDVMTTKVVTVSPEHSIRHAAKIMLDRGISGLPVLDDDGTIVGMLTEGDLLRRCELGMVSAVAVDDDDKAKEFVKSHGWFVRDVMTIPLAMVSEEATLADVAAAMLENGIKRVPVLRDGKLVGIVSRHDLLCAVADARIEEFITGDDRIRIGVLARLREAARILGELPSVEVRHGVILLGGAIRSDSVRRAIHVIAETVHGASGVDDRMVVNSSLTSPTA